MAQTSRIAQEAYRLSKNLPSRPQGFSVAPAVAPAEAVPEVEPTATVAVAKGGRFEALDVARGFAVCLMILSHGVKGLLTFEQIPQWGMVPIHLITKFSSSLFLLVFGVSLAIAVVPHIGTDSWPQRRKKLMVRGLVVLFWYKALTILEMSHLAGREEIWAALTYKAFPIYVEVLGFYAIALIWIPWVLPLWKASNALVRLLFPVVIFSCSILLSNSFDFFDSPILKAILVEHPDYYAWGQFSRAPIVFLGLLIGWMIQLSAETKWPRLLPVGVLLGAALTLFSLFLYHAGEGLSESLMQIALNAGKHPPELKFMLFSMGGALLILGLSIAGGKALASGLGFVRTIGKHSLQAFVFHIVVLFTFYRYLFDYFHKIEYSFALTLGISLIGMTYIWLVLKEWVRKNS